MFGLVNIEFCMVLLGYRIVYFVFGIVDNELYIVDDISL